MNGKLNLTKISFPIKLCRPKTALENAINHMIWYPRYLGVACRTTDPLERLKLFVILGIIGNYKYDGGQS